MYKVSEQQASELKHRLEAIKELTNPALFVQIELLVQQANSSKQLTDADVNLLYELLNRVTMDNEPIEETVQSEWEDVLKKETEEEYEIIKGNDMRNHMLLCNRANLRVVESMRQCVRLIVLPEKRKALSQDHL